MVYDDDSRRILVSMTLTEIKKKYLPTGDLETSFKILPSLSLFVIFFFHLSDQLALAHYVTTSQIRQSYIYDEGLRYTKCPKMTMNTTRYPREVKPTPYVLFNVPNSKFQTVSHYSGS